MPPEPLGFPAGLHFVVLDDSLTAQHLLKGRAAFARGMPDAWGLGPRVR